jgi:hypothetical protein
MVRTAFERVPNAGFCPPSPPSLRELEFFKVPHPWGKPEFFKVPHPWGI